MFATKHILLNSTELTGKAGFPKWCPTLNGCRHKAELRYKIPSKKGCQDDDLKLTRRPLAHLGICIEPRADAIKTDTTMSYIRHDYIYGHHGQAWNKNSVCDYWQEIVHNKDLIITSFGAHLPEVLSHPFGEPSTGGGGTTNVPFNSSIVRDLAQKSANKLKGNYENQRCPNFHQWKQRSQRI